MQDFASLPTWNGNAEPWYVRVEYSCGEVVEEAKSLRAEIDAFDDAQIEALQQALNELQLHLNRIQVETDAWAEEKKLCNDAVVVITLAFQEDLKRMAEEDGRMPSGAFTYVVHYP